ncbi:histidine kinase [Luteococcus sp. H138]|uniref:sensor histidine kinase n=1 Tax=unclassified Luteococcus TaxID=2639923 RepID=UPI00313ABCFB
MRRSAPRDSRTREQEAAARIAELTTARRQIVEAYEVERRRIERDLHDGSQQYLVAAAMKIGEAQLSEAIQHDRQTSELIAEAKQDVLNALTSLRKTVQGIPPDALTHDGLENALRAVAANAPVPVTITCPHPLPRIPAAVLASAYFFATEAITNAAKHAPHASVNVLLTAADSLRVSIVDDGPGGATLTPGHGLTGVRERLQAFGGDVTVTSPDGGPTHLLATIPLLLHRGEPGIDPTGTP